MLNGFRSRPVADQEALVRAILAITAFAERHAGRLRELDVNPLLVFPQGRGVLAVDALIRMSEEAVS